MFVGGTNMDTTRRRHRTSREVHRLSGQLGVRYRARGAWVGGGGRRRGGAGRRGPPGAVRFGGVRGGRRGPASAVVLPSGRGSPGRVALRPCGRRRGRPRRRDDTGYARERAGRRRGSVAPTWRQRARRLQLGLRIRGRRDRGRRGEEARPASWTPPDVSIVANASKCTTDLPYERPRRATGAAEGAAGDPRGHPTRGEPGAKERGKGTERAGTAHARPPLASSYVAPKALGRAGGRPKRTCRSILTGADAISSARAAGGCGRTREGCSAPTGRTAGASGVASSRPSNNRSVKSQSQAPQSTRASEGEGSRRGERGVFAPLAPERALGARTVRRPTAGPAAPSARPAPPAHLPLPDSPHGHATLAGWRQSMI